MRGRWLIVFAILAASASAALVTFIAFKGEHALFYFSQRKAHPVVVAEDAPVSELASDDWCEHRVGSDVLFLPPDLELVEDGPPRMRCFRSVNGDRTVMLAPTEASSSEVDSEIDVRELAAIYAVSSDDFSWSMSRSELRALRGRLAAKPIACSGWAERIYRFDTSGEQGILIQGGSQGSFLWQSSDRRQEQAGINFQDKRALTNSGDWMLEVCRRFRPGVGADD